MLGIGASRPRLFLPHPPHDPHTTRAEEKHVGDSQTEGEKHTPWWAPCPSSPVPTAGQLAPRQRTRARLPHASQQQKQHDHDRKKEKKRGGLESIELKQTEKQTQSKREEGTARGGREEQAGKREEEFFSCHLSAAVANQFQER